jgi:XapX domain-containing protein
MNGYLVSLVMGLAVGAAYGLFQVRSPARPMIALVGLFGMALGQQAVDMTKRHFVPSAHASNKRDGSSAKECPSSRPNDADGQTKGAWLGSLERRAVDPADPSHAALRRRAD